MNRILCLFLLSWLLDVIAFPSSPSSARRSLRLLSNNNKTPQSLHDIHRGDIRKFLDISKIAFGVITSVSSIPMISNAANKGFYLIEPTEEFKDEEKKVKDFGASRNKIRQKWDQILEKFKSTTKSEELASSLRELTKVIEDINDIPTGVKKTELVKVIRAKKFQESKKRKKDTFPYWTTDVEIAYNDLIRQYTKSANPDNSVRFHLMSLSIII